MTPANTWSMLTLIDSADADGRVHIRVPKSEAMRTKDHAREWLLTVFMELHLLTLKIDKVKKAISEVDLVLTPAENGTFLSLNLAKLLLLPAVAPAEELAEFRAMLVEMQVFFAAHPTERCDIQLCNERDRHRKVYGSLSCRIPDGPHHSKPDVAATAALNARIEGSQALTHWLRHVALALGKVGPWASAYIRGDNLFGHGDSPYSQHLLTRIASERATEPEKVFPLDI